MVGRYIPGRKRVTVPANRKEGHERHNEAEVENQAGKAYE